MQNEDTNQTLDYSFVEKVKEEAGIEDEEEAEQNEEEELEEGEEPLKKETIFLAGRIYREDTEVKSHSPQKPVEGQDAPSAPEVKLNTKWVYERWNKVVNSAEFPDLPQQLG